MAESAVAEERDAAQAAMRPAPVPREISTASTATRIPAAHPAAPQSRSTTAPLAAAGIIVLLAAVAGASLLSSSKDRSADTVARREPPPKPIVIPSPMPAPPPILPRALEPTRTPSETELKDKKVRDQRSADLEAVREQMRAPYLREEFKRARELVEQARARRADPEWADEIARLLSEIHAAAERLYGPLKEKSMDAARRGAAEDVKTHVERVAKWGLEDLSADLTLAISAATPAPHPPPLPASPDARLYAVRWETAVALAARRDYPAAVTSIESALPPLKEDAVKAEAAQDVEALRLAQTVPSEAIQLLAKWPADQKFAVKYFDEAGLPREVEGIVSRVEQSKLVLKQGPSTVTIELGEITPGSLGSIFLERRTKKPQTDARAVALFCLVEGDPDAVPKDVPGLPIPAKYQALARRLAEERVRTGSAEGRARALFTDAEAGFRSFPTRVEAIQKYKDLLKEYGDTAFVRRNRASMVSRAASGKEYFFFPSQFTAGGTFKIATDPKSEAFWTSSADTGKERIKENFIQLAFSALPETTYKCWVYVGACCGETFTFYAQVLDAGTESPDTASDDTPQLVKHSVSLPARVHAAHPGPKQPTRWAWIAVPLSKCAAAGPKRVRLLTNQQGFSVGYAIVSATRTGPPSEVDLKKMEKPSTETPLNAGLEAYWKFDEGRGTTVSDSSGKGNHGTIVRNAQWVEGKCGGALRFERDNYVHVPHVDSFAFRAADSFSVSLWANIPSPGGGWRSIFAKSRDVQPHYGLWVSNAGKWFFGGNEKGIEGCAVTTGWHHVAFLQNGSTRERSIYVDGVKCGSGPAADADGRGDLWIGAAKSVSEYLTGTVDEVRLYSRAISPAEIAMLAQTP
jgi:hypothetical protein